MSSIPHISAMKMLIIVVFAIAATSALWRLLETGDPYLFTDRFFADMVARLSGSGRLRFILQPAVAILLGARDGAKDARAGAPPFLSALLFNPHTERYQLLCNALASLRNLAVVAIILDLISQFLILRRVHLGAALIVGPMLIALPYAASRPLTNRIVRRRTVQKASVHIS